MKPSTLLLLCVAAGCGSPAATTLRPPDEYDGCATDENWRTFDDHELAGQVTVDDTQAASFTMPAAGATLPSATPPTFAWQPTPTIAGSPNGDASCEQCSACGTSSAGLGPDHLPPVSGDVYDLQFTVDGKVVWRIISTVQTWTPPASLWASWKGKAVSLASWHVVLKVNDVQSGPFAPSKPLAFQVGN